MYEVIIIGGGLAGLQAAIQLGRYQHDVLVIDTGYGRSTLCRSYHNLLGYPEGISGLELRQAGQRQAQGLGVQFVVDEASNIIKQDQFFQVVTADLKHFKGKRLLLATGVIDRIPPFSELYACLGLSVFICPDCDGYEVRDKKTLVLGAGDAGAAMAEALMFWTDRIIYINHEQKPISEELTMSLQQKELEVISSPITQILTKKPWEFQGVVLMDGRVLYAEGAFLAFGGNEVKSQLAEQLGVRLLDNRHIEVDARTKQTSVENVWAAGDVVAHSEQAMIAMGEGLQAAIWIHKSLT